MPYATGPAGLAILVRGSSRRIKIMRFRPANIRLSAAGKDQRKIITAVGRELLGFVWAIGTKAEAAARQRIAA